MKKKGSKIVVMQPGFFHPLAEIYDQHELEIALADIYLGWGDDVLSKGSSVEICSTGSLYCARSKGVRKGSCVVLPQVPRFQFRRAQSKSFGLGMEGFMDGLALKGLIQELKARKDNPILRVKKCDLTFYQKLCFQQGVVAEFHSGDINAGGDLPAFRAMDIAYCGTAIPEAFFSGADTRLLFGVDECHLRENVSFADSAGVVDGRIFKYAKPFEVDTFKQLIRNL